MLLTEEDLKVFNQEKIEAFDNNDDDDFGEVLRVNRIGAPKTQGHMLRYADGTENAFTFDE